MKKIISLVLTVLMLAALPGQVLADEPQDEKLTVTLDVLSFETDFYEDDVNVVYRNTPTSIIADVVDKESGTVLETYAEELDSGIQPRYNGPYEYERTAYKAFYPVDDVSVRAYFTVKIYVETVSGTTTRQIVELLDVEQALYGNNSRELEFSTWAEYDTTATTCTAQVVGIIRTNTPITQDAQYELIGMGYSVGSDNYARFDYDRDVTIALSAFQW